MQQQMEIRVAREDAVGTVITVDGEVIETVGGILLSIDPKDGCRIAVTFVEAKRGKEHKSVISAPFAGTIAGTFYGGSLQIHGREDA